METTKARSMDIANWKAFSGWAGIAFVALQFVVGGIYSSFGTPVNAADAAMVATALGVGCAYIWLGATSIALVRSKSRSE